MAFDMGYILAKSWGVEYGSDEYKAKHKEMRKRWQDNPTKLTVTPCGPACEICRDNSYTCGCVIGGVT